MIKALAQKFMLTKFNWYKKRHMFKIRIVFITMTLLLCCFWAHAQNKRALLIGLSKYGVNTGWNNIHGTNDIDLIKTKLIGFSIRELRNSSATYDNIISELNHLEKESQKGDTIYIHLSGHGQPVEDYDSDEPDGWDESFIPYDAHMIYDKLKYDGRKHLTDDVLHQYYELLRKKIGSQGALIVAIDACHSGESYRGDDEQEFFNLIDDEIVDECIIDSALTEINEYDSYERGTALGFSRNKKEYIVKKNSAKNKIVIKKQGSLSTILLLESCLSSQKSIELDILIKDKKGATRHYLCGPLSYCIYKNICKKKNISTNTDWFTSLNEIYSRVMYGRGRQQLVVEYSE